MSNTELQSIGGLERVESMFMRRRLRWLGHLKRSEDCRLPSAFLCVNQPREGDQLGAEEEMELYGDQMEDLRRCDLLEDWEETSHGGSVRCK